MASPFVNQKCQRQHRGEWHMWQALPCHRFVLRRDALAIIIPKTWVQYRMPQSLVQQESACHATWIKPAARFV